MSFLAKMASFITENNLFLSSSQIQGTRTRLTTCQYQLNKYVFSWFENFISTSSYQLKITHLVNRDMTHSLQLYRVNSDILSHTGGGDVFYSSDILDRHRRYYYDTSSCSLYHSYTRR